MQFTSKLLIVAASMLAISNYIHAAEQIFFSNTTPGGLYPTAHFDINHFEMADDAPFTDTQLLSSFRFGYSASEPVRVIFRFYGVDPATGNPGISSRNQGDINSSAQLGKTFYIDTGIQPEGI